MKTTKIISWITTISVLTMVLFGIVCPQLSLAKNTDHGSCFGTTNMLHLTEANNNFACEGLHLSASGRLPFVLPEGFSLISVLSAAVVLFFINAKLLKDKFLLIESVISRWRYFFKTYSLIKPELYLGFSTWLHLAEHPVIAE